MTTIMLYRIIEADSPEKFVHRVNKALADGWQCQGGLSVSTVTPAGFEGLGMGQRPAYLYAQALVKQADPPPEPPPVENCTFNDEYNIARRAGHEHGPAVDLANEALARRAAKKYP